MKFSDIAEIDYGRYKCDVPWDMVADKIEKDQQEAAATRFALKKDGI